MEAKMVRTQIQLTEEQARRLKRLAAEEGCSMAELIRRGVDRLLDGVTGTSREERKRRALAAAGRFRSGVHDLSTNHDQYLAQAYTSAEG
jgi:hypothetical protein